MTIENTNNNNRETYCQFWQKMFITTIILIAFYIGFILNWHLFRIIDHFIKTGDILDKSIDWHLFNAFYAMLVDLAIIFTIASIYDTTHRI